MIHCRYFNTSTLLVVFSIRRHFIQKHCTILPINMCLSGLLHSAKHTSIASAGFIMRNLSCYCHSRTICIVLLRDSNCVWPTVNPLSRHHHLTGLQNLWNESWQMKTQLLYAYKWIMQNSKESRFSVWNQDQVFHFQRHKNCKNPA